MPYNQQNNSKNALLLLNETFKNVRAGTVNTTKHELIKFAFAKWQRWIKAWFLVLNFWAEGLLFSYLDHETNIVFIQTRESSFSSPCAVSSVVFLVIKKQENN